jgi:hypothetical protein
VRASHYRGASSLTRNPLLNTSYCYPPSELAHLPPLDTVACSSYHLFSTCAPIYLSHLPIHPTPPAPSTYLSLIISISLIPLTSQHLSPMSPPPILLPLSLRHLDLSSVSASHPHPSTGSSLVYFFMPIISPDPCPRLPASLPRELLMQIHMGECRGNQVLHVQS